jgi:hypothetical protein
LSNRFSLHRLEDFMSEKFFGAFASHAADAMSRRASLSALSGAAMAIASAPTVTSAGKAGKKANRKCRRQGKQCRAFATAECGDDQECLDAFLPCCAFFSRCQAEPGLPCLVFAR